VPIILEEIANKLCFAINLCFPFLGRASRLQISHVVLQYHPDIHYPLAHANMLYLGEGKDMWKGHGNDNWCNA
jgi:hypothetical protein